jgi:hypothetical protein
MSRKLRDLVYETALPPGQRIVLGALVWHVNAARYAARGDTIVWPGLEELQERSRLGRTAVKRNLAGLRAAGLIEVVVAATPNASTHYRVVVEKLEMCARVARQDEAAKAEQRRTQHRRAEQQRRAAAKPQRVAAQRGLVSNPREQEVTGGRNEPPVVARHNAEPGVRFDRAGGSIRLSRGVVTNPEPRKEPGNEPKKYPPTPQGGPRAVVSIGGGGDEVRCAAHGTRKEMVEVKNTDIANTEEGPPERALSAAEGGQPPEDELAIRVAALPDGIREWFGATIGYAIATGTDHVAAWQTGVVDVLARFDPAMPLDQWAHEQNGGTAHPQDAA